MSEPLTPRRRPRDKGVYVVTRRIKQQLANKLNPALEAYRREMKSR